MSQEPLVRLFLAAGTWPRRDRGRVGFAFRVTAVLFASEICLLSVV